MTEQEKAELKAKMDAAADQARPQLMALVAKYPDAMLEFAQFWKANYVGAGHNRLGRMLVAIAK